MHLQIHHHQTLRQFPAPNNGNLKASKGLCSVPGLTFLRAVFQQHPEVLADST